MRILRLENGVLWIAAANDEKVRQVIITAGTWHEVYERNETRDEKHYVSVWPPRLFPSVSRGKCRR